STGATHRLSIWSIFPVRRQWRRAQPPLALARRDRVQIQSPIARQGAINEPLRNGWRRKRRAKGARLRLRFAIAGDAIASTSLRVDKRIFGKRAGKASPD